MLCRRQHLIIYVATNSYVSTLFIAVMVLLPFWTSLLALSTVVKHNDTSVSTNITTSSTNATTNALLARLLLARTLLARMQAVDSINNNNNTNSHSANNASGTLGGRHARYFRQFFDDEIIFVRPKKRYLPVRRAAFAVTDDADSEEQEASSSDNAEFAAASDYAAAPSMYGDGGGKKRKKGHAEKKPYKVFLEIPRPKPHIIPPKIIQVPVSGPIIVPRIKIGYEVRRPPPAEKIKCLYGCKKSAAGHGESADYGDGEPSGQYSDPFGSWLKKGSFISFSNDKDGKNDDDADEQDDYVNGGAVADPFAKSAEQKSSGSNEEYSGGSEEINYGGEQKTMHQPEHMMRGGGGGYIQADAAYSGKKSNGFDNSGSADGGGKYEIVGNMGGSYAEQQNQHSYTGRPQETVRMYVRSEENEKPQKNVAVKDFYYNMPADATTNNKYARRSKQKPPTKRYSGTMPEPSVVRGALVSPLHSGGEDYGGLKNNGYAVRALSSERRNIAARGRKNNDDEMLAYYDSVDLSSDNLAPPLDTGSKSQASSSAPAEFDITLRYDNEREAYVPTYSRDKEDSHAQRSPSRQSVRRQNRQKSWSSPFESYSGDAAKKSIRQTPYGDLIYASPWSRPVEIDEAQQSPSSDRGKKLYQPSDYVDERKRRRHRDEGNEESSYARITVSEPIVTNDSNNNESGDDGTNVSADDNDSVSSYY